MRDPESTLGVSLGQGVGLEALSLDDMLGEPDWVETEEPDWEEPQEGDCSLCASPLREFLDVALVADPLDHVSWRCREISSDKLARHKEHVLHEWRVGEFETATEEAEALAREMWTLFHLAEQLGRRVHDLQAWVRHLGQRLQREGEERQGPRLRTGGVS